MKQIKEIYGKSGRTYGSRKITAKLRRNGKFVNHKRIERLMREAAIRSRIAREFKATTNSKHSLPVAENILNREFDVDKPNQKMVSDITYLWADEGWLYIAAVMDLYGQIIVGLSLGERMTKELVINALESTWLRQGHGILINPQVSSHLRYRLTCPFNPPYSLKFKFRFLSDVQFTICFYCPSKGV